MLKAYKTNHMQHKYLEVNNQNVGLVRFTFLEIGDRGPNSAAGTAGTSPPE
jgi:hypothetical protein